MITPRATRLLRVAELRQFRAVLVRLLTDGSPLDARDRLVIVPTHAAASLLRSVLEEGAGGERALIAPDIVTRDELLPRLAARLPSPPPLLSAIEREVLLSAACDRAIDEGVEPPFRLRPGLVAEMLGFYDALRRNLKDVSAFERLAVESLEPDAALDRGAERLLRQTRFLVAAFRHLERRVAGSGALDEHALRAHLLATPARRPVRHLVVAHRDVAASASGLWPADVDLIARLPDLERVDVVATEETLAAGLLERLHASLPGLEEVREAGDWPVPRPLLVVPPAPKAGAAPSKEPDLLVRARDREAEVRSFARWVRAEAREAHATPLDRVALVVRRPLPYVYLARGVLRSAGVPCQFFDALPLAAEPPAAALDLVLTAVTSGFSRASLVALLGSPHFEFTRPADAAPSGAPVPGDGHLPFGEPAPSHLTQREVDALDRALAEDGCLGGVAELGRLAERWGADSRRSRVLAALRVAFEVSRELAGLTDSQPVRAHLLQLRAFVLAHGRRAAAADPLGSRLRRARAAVLSGLDALADAWSRYDERAMPPSDVAGVVRGWIERQTFAPRTGEGGVHVVDAESARFGAFDAVQVAGLVDGDWPLCPERSIFYSSGLLRQLGWPVETDRIQGERALFRDLLGLPAGRIRLSAFLLEDDALVGLSSLVDEVASRAWVQAPEPDLSTRIFEDEALVLGPPRPDVLGETAASWGRARLARLPHPEPHVQAVRWSMGRRGLSVSALERYQDCPFKFFAANVLRLEEPPEESVHPDPARPGPARARAAGALLPGVGPAAGRGHHRRTARRGADGVCRHRGGRAGRAG